MSDVFRFEQAGQPRLRSSEGQGSPALPSPGAPQTPPGGSVAELQQPPSETWTGEEAEVFLATLWNIGGLIYGPDWLAREGEMAVFRDDLAAELDWLLPKSIGGPVGHAIHVTKIAGGVGFMVARRAPLIKAGPKAGKENLRALAEARKRQAQQRGEEPPAAAGGAAPAAPSGPSGDDVAGGGGFKFEGKALEVLQHTPEAYTAFGITEAA